MLVRDLAHARAGDKGNRSNISVFAYDHAAYAVLADELTVEVVATELAPLVNGPVDRYDLPDLHAFNFVLDGALAGGVTTSLRIDAHGKSLSYALLGIEIPVDTTEHSRRGE